MPSPQAPRFGEAIVLGTKALTPHMYRLSFQSELAADFSPGAPGGYLKVVAPAPGETGPPPVDLANFKARMRTYTLRNVSPAEKTFDIDFVVHGDDGIAGPWASQAKPGDRILISRPGTLKFGTDGAAWHLFIADMAAIPAAAVELEALPPSAVGDAFFEILSEEDRQPIRTPAGINVHWIIKSDPHAPSDALTDAVTNMAWRDGTPSVFVAGEFALAGALRTYFRAERPTPKELTYVSSYWKLGLIEPEHKAFKAQMA